MADEMFHSRDHERVVLQQQVHLMQQQVQHLSQQLQAQQLANSNLNPAYQEIGRLKEENRQKEELIRQKEEEIKTWKRKYEGASFYIKNQQRSIDPLRLEIDALKQEVRKQAKQSQGTTDREAPGLQREQMFDQPQRTWGNQKPQVSNSSEYQQSSRTQGRAQHQQQQNNNRSARGQELRSQQYPRQDVQPPAQQRQHQNGQQSIRGRTSSTISNSNGYNATVPSIPLSSPTLLKTPPPRRPKPRNNVIGVYNTVGPSAVAVLGPQFAALMNSDRRIVSNGAASGSVAMQGNSEAPREERGDVFMGAPAKRRVGHIGQSGIPFLMEKIETPSDYWAKQQQLAEAMVVKYETRDDRVQRIGIDLDLLMKMITNWAERYCSRNGDILLPRVTEDDKKRMKLLYACLGPDNGRDLDAYILKFIGSKFVVHLLAAIMWRFFHSRMMLPNVLTGLLPNTYTAVVIAQQELMQTHDVDTSPEERRRKMSERIRAVNNIVHDDGFKDFRAEKIKECMTELRAIVRPFFGTSVPGSQAGAELNAIGIKAFDLLIMTLTESGVFVVRGCVAGQTFQTSSMKMAPYHREAPSRMFGVPVRLGIFPSVTFRDDSGGNIYTKMTNKAVVLLEDATLNSFAAKQ